LRKTLLHSIPSSCLCYGQSSSQINIANSISKKHGYINSVHQNITYRTLKDVRKHPRKVETHKTTCVVLHGEAMARPTSPLFMGNPGIGFSLGKPSQNLIFDLIIPKLMYKHHPKLIQ